MERDEGAEKYRINKNGTKISIKEVRSRTPIRKEKDLFPPEEWRPNGKKELDISKE